MALVELRKDLEKHLLVFNKIRFPVKFRSHATRIWNAHLGDIIDECYRAITTSSGPEMMFEAVTTMEKNISTLINTVLRYFNINDELSRLGDKINTLSQINEAMIDMDLCLTKYIDELINVKASENTGEELWENLQFIQMHISAYFNKQAHSHMEPLAISNLQSIILESKSVILNSLLKGSYNEHGMELIRLLRQNFNDERKLIIMPFIACIEQSLSISPVGEEAYKQEQKQESKDMVMDIEQRDIAWENGSGSGSVLSIPVLITEDDMLSNLNIALTRENIVQNTMNNLMIGGLSLDPTGVSFIPFQVQIIHELIHALHNAQGANSRDIYLRPGEERKLWETYEEYVTIKSGTINESQFITEYGAIAREHHGGISSSVLFNAEKRQASQTILAALNDDDDLLYEMNKDQQSKEQEIVSNENGPSMRLR